MKLNPRLQEAITEAEQLKGEPLTEQETFRVYLAQFMKDRKAGQLDEYDEEEIQQNIEIIDSVLNKSLNDEIKRLLKEQTAPESEYKHNRTRSASHKAGAIKDMPTSLAIPTLAGYQYAMTLHDDIEGGAYLQQFKSMNGLNFKNGTLYIDSEESPNLRKVSEVELQNLQTREGITDIDTGFLGYLYTNVLYEFAKTGGRKLSDIIVMNVYELANRIGWQGNLNNENILQLVKQVQSFHNIVGVMKVKRPNGKDDKAYYQVLNFEYYDPATNNIAFSSPYMNKIISTIFNLAEMKAKSGKLLKKKNGATYMLPNHSYMIDSSIVKERNKAAVENVKLIVQTIERAGDNIPHLKASTIIERNEQLKERLENNENKRRLLQRVFSKTWELLRDKTQLADAYEGIGVTACFEKLSDATPLKNIDPKNPALIPNMSTLNDLVFYFPHKGKHKEK